MARKKKPPEHENLERWMVSYADFVTLLFATFVVLYALSQVDIKDFKALESSIKQAFAAPSVIQGTDGIMDASSNTIFDTSQGDSLIAPLMMEYVSQKYEEDSMNDIQKSINSENKSGDMGGVEAIKTDRGLLIRFSDDCLFKSGSAALTPQAKTKLDKIGASICTKFVLHNMRIEGHTDNRPVSGAFPSNWELSSARASAIIRYLIGRFHLMPNLFTAVGFADTRPLASNSSEAGRAKNRRVEILILKNKYRTQESANANITKMSKADQEQLQTRRMEAINSVEGMSSAAQKLSHGDKQAEKNAIILNKVYNEETTRISGETKALDAPTREKVTGQGDWLKPPASTKVSAFHKKQ